MAAEIIPLGNITSLDLPPDRILESAKGQMTGVVLLGWDNDGQLYFASSYADGLKVLWLLEKAKTELLSIAND